jgi:hypothetical protein
MAGDAPNDGQVMRRATEGLGHRARPDHHAQQRNVVSASPDSLV